MAETCSLPISRLQTFRGSGTGVKSRDVDYMDQLLRLLQLCFLLEIHSVTPWERRGEDEEGRKREEQRQEEETRGGEEKKERTCFKFSSLNLLT